MYKQNNSSFLTSPLLLLIDFINNRCNLTLEVSFINSRDFESEFDCDIFFKAGQLLMFLYVLNIKNVSRENIKYRNNKFYIYMPINNSNEINIKKITAENIIINLIDKSTYNQEFLPEYLENINKENLFQIERGFELTYKLFIDEKINLINFLNKYVIKNSYINLIENIQLLNPHDLNIQLKFIRLKFQRELITIKSLKKLISQKNNHANFIESSRNVLDILIKNSIISLDENGIELMWIGYTNNKLEPTRYKNIYIAILLSYIGKTMSEKYYLQAAKQSLNPLLMDLVDSTIDYKKICGNEYYDVLKLLFLLNNYIEFEELDNFIEKNPSLFNLISLEDKLKCNSETETFILEYIYNKSLDLLNSLILA